MPISNDGKWKCEILNENKEVAITRFLNKEFSGDLIIPEVIQVDETDYQVTSIGSFVFSGCSSLTSINIPKFVKSITYSTFFGCHSLNKIYVAIDNLIYSSIDNVLFNEDKTTLIYYPQNKKNESYEVPDTVTYIGDFAFAGCTSLTSINLHSVQSIGDSAFADCSSLPSINIPVSVTSIEKYAFAGCTSLTFIYIHNSNTNIEKNSFYGCFSLVINGKNNNIKNNIVYKFAKKHHFQFFNTETNKIENKDEKNKKDAILVLEKMTDGYFFISKFVDNKEERKIILNDKKTYPYTIKTSSEYPIIPKQYNDSKTNDCTDITAIADRAFFRHNLIKKITIPNNIKFIGTYAFANCLALKKVKFENEENLFIGEGAFSKCRSLEDITMPKSIQNISNAVFYGCDKLKEVRFEGSVFSIGDWAFSECKLLEKIHFPNCLQTLASIGDGAFFGCTSLDFSLKNKLLNHFEKINHKKDKSWIFADSLQIQPQGTDTEKDFIESFNRFFSNFLNEADMIKFENMKFLPNITELQSRYKEMKKFSVIYKETCKNYEEFKSFLFNPDQDNCQEKLQNSIVDKIFNRLLNSENISYIAKISPYQNFYRARVIKDQDYQKNITDLDSSQYCCSNGLLYSDKSFSDREYKTGFNENNHREPIFSKNGGRNNYNEISYLYLSKDKITTIAELRPAIGSEISLATFKSLKTLKLFDLTGFVDEIIGKANVQKGKTNINEQFYIEYNGKYIPEYTNPFLDHLFLVTLAFGYNIHLGILLDLFVQELHKPAYDTETDYRVSQYIADRIQKAGFDGIQYKSSRNVNGINITLFHSSSSYLTFIGSEVRKIEKMDIKLDKEGE